MRRHDRPWILFLSTLAILIGCQTLNLGQAATQQEPGVHRIEPLPETTGSALEAEADAQGLDAAPQETASAAQEPPPPPPRKVEQPTSSVPEGGCVTTDCHPGIKAHVFKHGPVNSDTCEACHEEADPTQHTFTFSEEDEELCASCHDLELDQKYVHSPAAEGQCIECHDPHGGQDRYLLRGGGGAALCNECHDDVTEDMPAVHGPVAAGACSACHRAHS